MKVINFPNPSLNDIPEMMRRLADDIEKGEYGNAVAAAMVLETDSTVLNFGWGDAEPMRAIGLLTTGVSLMTNGM